MTFQLSQFFNSHKYRHVSQSDTETGLNHNDDNKHYLYSSPNLFSLLTSRRVRILLLSVSFVVLSLFIIHLFSPSITKNIGWLTNSTSISTHDNSNIIKDWSQFAYVQYVTDTNYLCNSVMLFEILHRLGSKADRLMMYPSNYNPNLTAESTEAQLLLKAQVEYKVKLAPINVVQKENSDSTWDQSYTKLLAFNQTQYKRVLSLDSDSTVLQHMDELFLLPPTPIAMPRAYWLDPADHVLSSQLMLIQPSKREFSRIKEAIRTASDGEYDMEIINKLYGNSATVLPHRIYDLVTGEFRAKDHSRFFGNENETWNAETTLQEAKFLHFSDWPVPKPWLRNNDMIMEAKQPPCVMDGSSGQLDCKNRDLWLGFYEDFRIRRKEVCNLDVIDRKRSSGVDPDMLRPRAWEYVA